MRRLDGTRDLLDGEWARLNSLIASLREFFSRRGYQPVDTPLLEPTELFLKKSGGELASRLYTFTDQGGCRVSLRPEFTSSIIRAYIQGAVSPPVRWQYAGPVFRYQEDAQRPRQFTQLGAELIGDGFLRADAEIVGLACQGLAHVGLAPLRLRVGHVGALFRLLAGFGLSERTRWFLAGRVSTLAAGPSASGRLREEMGRLGLYGPPAELPLPAGVSTRDAHHVVERLLAGMGGLVGSRDPEEIVSRYLSKLEAADDPGRVDRALAFLEELAALSGRPQAVLAGLLGLASSYRLDAAPLEELQELLGLLSPEQVAQAQVELDLGLARGLAYYTGVVFDVYSSGDSRPLGGGGRYDGLVKALGGGEDTPALGFAYTLEAVQATLSARPGKD